MPGAPSSRSGPPRWSTAARCSGSRSGAGSGRPGPPDQAQPRAPRGLAVGGAGSDGHDVDLTTATPTVRARTQAPSQRARRMSTRRPSGRSGVPSSRYSAAPRSPCPASERAVGPQHPPPRDAAAEVGQDPADLPRAAGAEILRDVAVAHHPSLRDLLDHLQDVQRVRRRLEPAHRRPGPGTVSTSGGSGRRPAPRPAPRRRHASRPGGRPPATSSQALRRASARAAVQDDSLVERQLLPGVTIVKCRRRATRPQPGMVTISRSPGSRTSTRTKSSTPASRAASRSASSRAVIESEPEGAPTTCESSAGSVAAEGSPQKPS